MKILVVVTSHFGYDGISNVASNYYVYQDHSRIKMDLVTINKIPVKLKTEFENNGDQSYVLPQRNKNPLIYIHSLAKLIRQKNYDIVHIHGNSCTMFIELFAAILGGCKIRIAHSHNTKCDHVIINNLLRPFFRLSYTNGFACGIEAGKWLFNDDEFKVISNGVDLKRFVLNREIRNTLKKELNVDGRIVIGHVGRFSKQKNHKKLISIFSCIKKHIHNATLLMWGEGELMPQIKDLAKNIGGDIRFMGTSNKIEKFLQVVDIVIFPSLYEGLPLFLIEAQSLGLPCLLSDTVSPYAKITDYVYFQSLEASNEDWARKTFEILSVSKVENNAEKAHSYIRNAGYDIRTNSEKLFQIYKQLIKMRLCKK